jgi:hypothetical protein
MNLCLRCDAPSCQKGPVACCDDFKADLDKVMREVQKAWNSAAPGKRIYQYTADKRLKDGPQ